MRTAPPLATSHVDTKPPDPPPSYRKIRNVYFRHDATPEMLPGAFSRAIVGAVETMITLLGHEAAEEFGRARGYSDDALDAICDGAISAHRPPPPAVVVVVRGLHA
jgi:hypothetical protein